MSKSESKKKKLNIYRETVKFETESEPSYWFYLENCLKK